MMSLSRVVWALFIGAICATASPRAVFAQRTMTASDIEAADARRRAILERQRDSAARVARIVEEKTSRASRLSVVNEPIPGMPFIVSHTVVVTRNRVVFMYLEPDVTVSLPKAERQGYYVWRWNMTDGSNPFSIVMVADTAMRSADFGDIVKSARIRRCNSTFESRALECKNPVQGFVTRQGQGFRLEVSDSLIYKSMMTAQPRTVFGLTFSPLGRSVSTVYNVIYSDPKVKADR